MSNRTIRKIVERENGLGCLTLNVELSPRMICDQIQRLVELEETIKQRVRAVLGFTPRVKLVEPETLQKVGVINCVVDDGDN